MTNKKKQLMLSLILASFIIFGTLTCASATSENNTNITVSSNINYINDNNFITPKDVNQTLNNNLKSEVNNNLTEPTSVNLNANNLTKYYGDNESFIVTLTDQNKNPINNQNISLNLVKSNGKNKTYFNTTDYNGKASLAINLSPGIYYIISTYNGYNINNTVKILFNTSYLNANDFYETFEDGLNFTGYLKDCESNPIAGMHIALNLTRLSSGANKVYWATTDTNGEYRLQINLAPGKYTINSSFFGYSGKSLYFPAATSIINNIEVYDNLSEDEGNLSNDSIENGYVSIIKISEGANLIVNSVKSNGTLPSTIMINNNIYSISQFINLMIKSIIEINEGSTNDIEVTNLTGALNSSILSVTGTLSKEDIVSMASRIETYILKNNRLANYDSSNGLGKITYENYAYIFAETLSYYKNYNVLPSTLKVNTNIFTKGGITEVISSNSGYYTLTTLNWGTGGDLTKNSVIMNNIDNTTLTQKVLESSKNGTVLLTFGNGNGKKIFINAGVHGNELSSIAAAFKLINTLSNLDQSKINGTIYVICDLCPASAATSTRYFNGVNLNSAASTEGTISNNLIKIAESLNIEILGDYHCTMPGGTPGANTVFGTYAPTSESATIASYISNKCSVSKIIYSYAGVEYTGAVEDVCNLNGIAAVTCEVVTSHGTIASGSLEKSYNMMISLLQYSGFNI